MDDAAVKRVTAAIARGSSAALDEFYRAWFDWAYQMARTLTERDESFCLDVVQESMLRVARSLRGMDGLADLERWMTRVVHTTALDLLRRESRRAARERAPRADTGGGAAADGVESTERAEWVRGRLAALPAEDRWMVWLRFGRGRTLADTGAAAGIGEQAAHGRIRRALARLRAKTRGDEP
jgi:RNA polymerase sigma factor (sigma-70 family)